MQLGRPGRTSVRAVSAGALAAVVVAGALAAWPARASTLESPNLRRPCDHTDPALCLLPFPNDLFTRADPSTDTGRRVDFQLAEMPRSVAGKPIDPTEWNRNDGFSPGSEVLAFVPGLDLHQTWGTAAMAGPGVGGPNDPRDHLADIGRYQAADAPILLIDAGTGERWPFWSELDHNAATGPGERLLILRPARNFLEGHRYLVALRNLRDGAGNPIPAGPQFAAYRDGTEGPAGDVTFDGDQARRDHLGDVIDAVEGAEESRGAAFDRSDLYLAWDFTVASRRNLSERALTIRDHAFGLLGDNDLADHEIAGSAPPFTVTKVVDAATLDNPSKLRQVEGTITVPNYLDRPPVPPSDDDLPVADVPPQAVPGARFLYGPDGLPRQNPALPTIEVPFVCTLPAAASAAERAHPLLYGHGLLGSRYESTGGSTARDRERNFMPCATNWLGFANYDLGNAAATLADPSNMATMADRSQQGFLNFLYLGRALAHPDGLATHPAFRSGDGEPLVRTGELFYDGNSQGGIMGGALTALSVDVTRSVLGVTGMNYSTLLNRSADWEGPLVNPDDPGIPSYSSVLYTMFPDHQEQQLVMALLQMLWDRAEANGYAEHMTDDPLPNTPAHQVLLHAALGDFQVTNLSAEVEARTVGARVLDTSLLPGRHWAAAPFFGLVPFDRGGSGEVLPWAGSALIVWDSGNLPPPNANVPPAPTGGDPHEDVRRDPLGGDQKAHFWLTGEVVDVHAGGPYLACDPGATAQIPRVPGQVALADWCL